VSSGTAAPGTPLTDGRILRAERTRRVVVETFLDLVQEGELHPTAQQVSDRSGVSMRSIFRLFQDVDALHSAAIAAQLQRVAHLFEAPDATGPVESRMAALIARRTRLYETIAPVRRMAIRLAPRSLPIAAELARANTILRDQLMVLFAPELALRSGQQAGSIEALDALTSWETWDRLRGAQGLEADEAAAVVTTTALGVLR
jgi:TetR/AcrR family transcriptional regulator, regulator of autoinduction and epiphytic fitness